MDLTDIFEAKAKTDPKKIVFPDLNVGNIGVKLLQCMADTSNFGAILQGFATPVSDLSRGDGVKRSSLPPSWR